MSRTIDLPLTREDSVARALKTYWGFESLRPLQADVIEAALSNRDAVVVMPTGGGKSLCFQIPPIVEERLTVVVSPLIALMKDQVDSLTVVGIPAAALNSSLSEAEETAIKQDVVAGKLRLLYVSPERLLLSRTLQLLASADQGKGVARFAIDEAHCISAWGHDFRPEFRQLSRIKEVFPGAPIQAFTATATPQVQRDIAMQLKLERPRRFVGTFDRPNLTYRVVAKDDPVRRTIEAVRRYPDEGVIVYCLSRKDTEAIASALVAQGIQAVAYHAGLSPEIRKKVSEDFARERANIIVATIAFGMGIDRANVRCVIHECLPKSMEGYQQETGRAGRDGLPSDCVLLYSHGDVMRLKRLLADGEPEVVAHSSKLLEEVRRFATSHQCRHKALSEHFGQSYEVAEDGCGACDVCLGGMQPLADGTRIGRQILSTATSLLEQGRGRSFGVGLLAAILVGSKSKQVLDRRGETVDGFGAFAGKEQERVTSWIHQLTDLGLVEVSEGQYPVVSVTESGRSLLFSGEEIFLVENAAMLAPAGGKKSKSSSFAVPEKDRALFDELRGWRRSVAEARGVPAYVILHDATLMRIAAIRPSTVANLRFISGLGDRRVEDFGAELVELILRYAAHDNSELDQPNSSTKIAPASKAPSAKTSSYAAYFRRGMSVEAAAQTAGIKSSTMWQHLANWVEMEKPDSIAPWIDEQTLNKVAAALALDETGYLKPVYESLEGAVSYDLIRLVKAYAQPRG